MSLVPYIILGVIPFSSPVTYKKDVKPIVQKHCASCHGKNWSDKNWLDYDKAKEFSEKIKLRVVERKDMPPGNMTKMSDKERETIKLWVEQGAKK